ncbi:MAG: hypothetical protein Q9184_004242 [Pyrenodesmia sp. 2 TL-2023]
MGDRISTSSPCPNSPTLISLPDEAGSTEITEPTLTPSNITFPDDLSTGLLQSEVASDRSSPKTVVPDPPSPQDATASQHEGPSSHRYSDNSESMASLHANPPPQLEGTLSNAPPQTASDITTGKAPQALDAHPIKAAKSDQIKPPEADETESPKLDVASLSPEDFKTSTPSSHQNPKRPGHLISDPQSQLVFLYPFKFFVTFTNKIKAEADRLKTTFGHFGQPGQLRTPTSPDDLEDSKSEKAFEHLTLATKLMDNYLQPIFDLHESYRNATHCTIFFQDLWPLSETGGLLFQCEPLPDYPPRLTRLIYCDGGANSKGVENQFCSNHYHLDFTRDFYGPAWEGERSVYDLKLYPLAFVRNHKDHNFGSLNDYKSHLVERGKGFVELGAIHRRYYSGEYSSPVVIDFKLQKRDTAPQPGLLGWVDTLLKSESDFNTWFSIYPRDPPEVREGTLRANSTEVVTTQSKREGTAKPQNEIEFCYNVKHVSRNGRSGVRNPWSIRQIGIYEKLDVDIGQSV